MTNRPLFSGWDRIVQALSAPLTTLQSLQDAIVTIRGIVHPQNPRVNDLSLRSYLSTPAYAQWCLEVLPFVQQSFLRLPTLFPEGTIPILSQGTDRTLEFTKIQCCALLSMMFFEAVPFWGGDSDRMPPFDDFSHLHAGCCPAFLESIFLYFQRMSKPAEQARLQNEKVTIHRRVLPTAETPTWGELTTPLAPAHFSPSLRIQPDGAVEADFANRYIGGGVLQGGCVQEEIMFGMSPECLVSLLVCEYMLPNEVITLRGPELVGLCEGYGRKVRCTGEAPVAPGTDWSRRLIVAMDALECYQYPAQHQYTPSLMDRELTKAYLAFAHDPTCAAIDPPDRPLTTGHWGCGAFGGHKPLKALLQVMAASQARRALQYSTFGEEPFAQALQAVVDALIEQHWTVGRLYAAIVKYGRSCDDEVPFLPWICKEAAVTVFFWSMYQFRLFLLPFFLPRQHELNVPFLIPACSSHTTCSSGYVALQLAEQCSSLLQRAIKEEQVIETKSTFADLVTAYDKKVEEIIISTVRRAFPDHGIVSEESFPVSPAEWKEWSWVVDPIDGTTNWANQNPVFAISIGLAHRAVPIMGVIALPSLREVVYAIRGRGSFYYKPETKQFTVREPSNVPQDCLLTTGIGYERGPLLQATMGYFMEQLPLCRAIRLSGSACWDNVMVATGRISGYWERRLKVWDYCAGSVIAQESGCRATRFDGRPVRLDDGAEDYIVAAPRVHDYMVRTLATHQFYLAGQPTPH
ncbi:putative poly glycohydrolase [Paratrimastix pyriformis]|uniref:poly(ADP-ribose) glycohydrolase n=1 Tax=Paratrimastix pyriformis TaxID=342808 RepID=A0ABQ8V1K3_9EUKA|nr:putative poly glycohydrolase [Paratrimastix pyriformis]